jgi:hypothetical protein
MPELLLIDTLLLLSCRICLFCSCVKFLRFRRNTEPDAVEMFENLRQFECWSGLILL